MDGTGRPVRREAVRVGRGLSFVLIYWNPGGSFRMTKMTATTPQTRELKIVANKGNVLVRNLLL